MTHEQWEADVPDQITSDTAWRIKAYRLALFLSDLVWLDVEPHLQSRRTCEMMDQLSRAAGKISPCIVEGYSRDTGKARSTFCEYALGSTREARDWYYKVRRLFKPEVLTHRLDHCTEITKLTLAMIANERRTNRRASRRPQ